MNVEIDDTYAEAFDGLFMRIIITAKDLKRLQKAAMTSTALPSTVINRLEGGIEKWLSKEETPDNRIGALIQFWGQIDKNKENSNTMIIDRKG